MAASIIVPLLPRVELNASFLGNGAEQTVTLPTVHVVPFYYAKLIVRVHEATWNAGAYFRAEGYGSYPASEDAREFVESAAGISATVFQTATLPAVGTGSASNLPVAYKFVGKLHMSTTSASWFAVVSVDLLLRAKGQWAVLNNRRSCGCGSKGGALQGLDVAAPPQTDECTSECADGKPVTCTAGKGQFCTAADFFGCSVFDSATGSLVSVTGCIKPPPPSSQPTPSASLDVGAPPVLSTCKKTCKDGSNLQCTGNTCGTAAGGCWAKDLNGKLIPSETKFCLSAPKPKPTP